MTDVSNPDPSDPVPGSLPIQASTFTIGSIAALIAFVAAITVTLVVAGSGSDATTIDVASPVAIAAVPQPGQVEPGSAGEDANPTDQPEGAAAPFTAATALPEPTTGVQPTVQPVPPPTSTPPPSSTPPPTPTATPPPTTPLPQPRVTAVPTVAAGSFDPQPLPAGPVYLSIAGGVELVLQPSRPALHLPGHSAIYLDDQYSGESNIFTPYADRLGRRVRDLEAVVDIVTAPPLRLEEVDHIMVSGYPALVFHGTPDELEVVFYTAPGSSSDTNAGWRTPSNLLMWVIDGPSGVVVVTAEALEANASSFGAAVELAEDIVFTMTIF